MHLIQGSMPVAAFEAKFAEWSRFAACVINTEEKKAKRFQKGLKFNLWASLAPFLPKNYADLVKRAIVLEGELAETQKIRDKKTKNKILNANQDGRNSQHNNSKKQKIENLHRPVVPSNMSTPVTCEHCGETTNQANADSKVEVVSNVVSQVTALKIVHKCSSSNSHRSNQGEITVERTKIRGLRIKERSWL